MDYFKRLTRGLTWKIPLTPIFREDSTRLPFFGPLEITDYKQFLERSKQKFYERYRGHSAALTTLDEFRFLRTLAGGGYGKIILVEQISDKEKSLYAMKVVLKSFTLKHNCVENILNEKKILQSLDCPFCVRLEYFCQSNQHLYLFLPFVSGGDLFTHLRRAQKFEENLAQFYAAQIVLALEFMHYCDVIHRDLKPENILIDHFGFVKIADFGFAKVITSRTYTFCGTIEYAAPEVILGKGYGKSVDWWSLGILLYEMSSGKAPFISRSDIRTCEKILHGEYKMPDYFSTELKDLTRRLIVKDPTMRAGNLVEGVDEIKSHTWFAGIDWMELLNRKVVPPFVPDHTERFSSVNFPSITNRISDVSFSTPSEFQEQFKDF